MKAIYTPKPIYCVVIEDDGDNVILEPVDGTIDNRFSVSLGDPGLNLDPTDTDLREAGL